MSAKDYNLIAVSEEIDFEILVVCAISLMLTVIFYLYIEKISRVCIEYNQAEATMFVIAGERKTKEEVFWIPVTTNTGFWGKSQATALKFFHPAQAERFLKKYVKPHYPEAYVKEL